MIEKKFLDQLDKSLSPLEIEQVTIHFDFDLDANNSLFEIMVDDGPVDPREIIPHLPPERNKPGYGTMLKDWLSETARKKETYVYLAVFALFVGVFGRITTAVIDEELLAMVEMPEMMTPPPERTPPPPPPEATPEPTPPPEDEPMPTPKPMDQMEQKLEDLDNQQELKELQIDQPKTDLARDLQNSQLNAVKDSDNSAGVISRRFANTTGKATDNSSVNLSNVGRKPVRQDSQGTSKLKRIGSTPKAKDTGAGSKALGDLGGKKKSNTDSGSGGTINWIKLPSTGPVAHLQYRCQGKTGYVVAGNYRLLCGSDKIQSAWIRGN
ncbi:MAG: hypothetical protein P9L99_07175 [Candidatus Lernaella stagnicola]|nr:hypothetical protein [Candidatus Lernaella stagnicola]